MSPPLPSVRLIVFDDRDHPLPRTRPPTSSSLSPFSFPLSLCKTRGKSGEGEGPQQISPFLLCTCVTVSVLYCPFLYYLWISASAHLLSFLALSFRSRCPCTCCITYLSIYLSLSFYLFVIFPVSNHLSLFVYFRSFPLS